jgi:hypothetical protein
LGNRLRDQREHDRHRAGQRQHPLHRREAIGKHHFWCQCQQFRSGSPSPIDVEDAPTNVDRKTSTDRPPQPVEALQQRHEANLGVRIVLSVGHQYADPAHSLALLRLSRQRPRNGNPAEPRDEISAPHSITSSALSRIDCGTVRRSTLAVLRFTAISNLIGS